MRRTQFASKAPARREAKQYAGSSPSTPRKPAPRVVETGAQIVVLIPKTPERKSQAIRNSARGEECQVRIVGACNSDPETTVWSHLPSLDGGRGMGMKSIDEAGAYCCSGCHDAIDGRRGAPPGASSTSMLIDWCRGHFRSLVILKQKGIL